MNLYPHQEKALEESKGLSRVAYYWDIGLGKTFIGSEKLSELGAGVNLVICQKSKIRDWMIKKMALSILKLAKPMMGNKSLRLTGKMIGMDVERVLPAIFASLSKEKIQEALKQTK